MTFCWNTISQTNLRLALYLITSDLQTTWKYIVLSSCHNIGYYNTHKPVTCLCSFEATSCTIGLSNSAVLNNCKQWFICSVWSSGALIQTYRVILMLCVCMRYQNHSTGIPPFPVLTPTSLHCFQCVCTTSLCAQLPHTYSVFITTSRELALHWTLNEIILK